LASRLSIVIPAERHSRKATYTHFPEIDPRLRNYRSRYGAISND
jgi:hypothetical protein